MQFLPHEASTGVVNYLKIVDMIFDKSVIERVIENMINFATNNVGDGGKVEIATQKMEDGKLHFMFYYNGTQIPKRFHDKIVCAQFQTRYDVCFLVTGGEHNDGCVEGLRAHANETTKFNAVNLWHEDVKNDDAGGGFAQGSESHDGV